MKKLILTIALLLISAPAFANHQEKIDIHVDGMICDFCAQSVWKVFEEYKEVENINIDLDSGTVTLTLKPDMTLDDERLNKGIYYAGYKLVSVERKRAKHS
jgi:copper chaperone CopZ